MNPDSPSPLTSAREAAYLAVLSARHQDAYAADFLEQWRRSAHPSPQDYKMAQEIAYGTIRMAYALDFMAGQLADRKKLSLKPKERALLRCAIYQHAFMTRIPIYALVNESVALAKKYCHATFVAFLNAVLRRLSEVKLALPVGDSAEAQSVRLSYPLYFVQQVLKDYDHDVAREILELGNRPSPTMYRVRPGADVKVMDAETALANVASNSQYYIQNATPVHLMRTLSDAWGKGQPQSILDLCAAPGGKLLAVHDRFPQAHLYANDVSKKKLEILQSNAAKYGLKVQLSCLHGEEYRAEQPFDIAILDVPCSNTGVLNKRPEARWRLSEGYLLQQEQLQKKLLEHAVELIKPDGEIWYMTCSILKRENEALVQWAVEHLGLRVKKEERVLPTAEGWDGGYACALVHRTFSM